jgi:hypothetical protein
MPRSYRCDFAPVLKPPIFEGGPRSCVAAQRLDLASEHDALWSATRRGLAIAKKFENFGNEGAAADLSSPTADFVFF